MADSLTALLRVFGTSETGAVRSNLVYLLSEPTSDILSEFEVAWQSVPVERKRILFAQLVESGETNFELDFASIAQVGLGDDDPIVRQSAVEMLWHNTETRVLRRLVDVALNDVSEDVRQAALISIGRYVLAGELGEIIPEAAQEAEQALRTVLSDEGSSIPIYRRALESLAYSSSDAITRLIKDASAHPDIRMQASAIHAMGRNADPRWKAAILGALGHEEPEIRYEAAKASGEMALSEAVPELIAMLDEQDQEILEAAVWSLGEIGGRPAQRALMELLDEDWDAVFVEAIEDAIEMASLNSGQFKGALLELDDFDDSGQDDAMTEDAVD